MKEKHPKFVAELEEHGLIHIKIASDVDDTSSFTGSSWKSAYKTDDKKVAEERAAKLGTKLEWIGNSAKTITGPVPAIRFDEVSHRKTWFNSLAVTLGVPTSVKNRNTSVELGNGDHVDADAMKDMLDIMKEECVAIPWKKGDVMKDMLDIMKEECVAIPWKKGDVMLVNNLTVLHSRRPVIKGPRRVLASLCK